jgi:hypothetical protein
VESFSSHGMGVAGPLVSMNIRLQPTSRSNSADSCTARARWPWQWMTDR